MGFRYRGSPDFEKFVTGGMTADYFHRGLGNTQIIGEELDNRLVGFAVLRGSAHRYAVFTIRDLYDFGLFGVGLYRNRDPKRHDPQHRRANAH